MKKEEKEIFEKVEEMSKKNKNYAEKETLRNSWKKFEKMKKNLFQENILKYGNNKLDYNIARFTLPEVVTCCANCHGCYAKKRLFKNVKEYRLKNLFLIESILKNEYLKKIFLAKLNFELKIHELKCKHNKKKAIFRFHDSGDIYSKEYFELIKEIIKQNKNIVFYTYTKNFHIFAEYQKNKLEEIFSNFHIVSSFIYNHVNYFDFNNNYEKEIFELEEIIKRARKEKKKIFLCNYNMEKLEEEKRNKLKELKRKYKNFTYFERHATCGKCIKCTQKNIDFVIFLKH